MKKIVLILLSLMLLINSSGVDAANTYTLSAVVGNSNHAPIVTAVVPDSNPRYLDNSVEGGTLVQQNYSIKFRDDENDTVDYTITVESDGGTAVNNDGDTFGQITSYDVNDEAYIFFTYTAPYTAVGAKTITVTMTDGPNVTVETINVYIY